MKTMWIAAIALLVGATGAGAQTCDYGPNSTSPFAPGAHPDGGSLARVRPAPRPGDGPIGFEYEWRNVVIQRGVRPTSLPLVACVITGSAAARAGLRPGDTIISVNGRDPRVRGTFAERRIGTRWVMRIERGGEEREVSFAIEAPAPQPTA